MFFLLDTKMGFFSKLKNELKFQKLGKGHSLNSQPAAQQLPPQPKAQTQAPVQKSSSHAQNAAREAALARFNKSSSKTNSSGSSSSTSNNNILRRARLELLEEKKRQLEQEEKDNNDLVKLSLNTSQEEVEAPKVAQNYGVYFRCPLTHALIQRHQFDSHLSSLFMQFIENQSEASSGDSDDRKILLQILYTLNECSLEKWQVCMKTLNTYWNRTLSFLHLCMMTLSCGSKS